MQRPSRSTRRARHAAVTTTPAWWNSIAERPELRDRSRRGFPGHLPAPPRPAVPGPVPAAAADELSNWIRESGPPPQPSVLELHHPWELPPASFARVVALSRALRRAVIGLLRSLGVGRRQHGILRALRSIAPHTPGCAAMHRVPAIGAGELTWNGAPAVGLAVVREWVHAAVRWLRSSAGRVRAAEWRSYPAQDRRLMFRAATVLGLSGIAARTKCAVRRLPSPDARQLTGAAAALGLACVAARAHRGARGPVTSSARATTWAGSRRSMPTEKRRTVCAALLPSADVDRLMRRAAVVVGLAGVAAWVHRGVRVLPTLDARQLMRGVAAAVGPAGVAAWVHGALSRLRSVDVWALKWRAAEAVLFGWASVRERCAARRARFIGSGARRRGATRSAARLGDAGERG
ncbi:hypothetical protein [Nocardia sp. NPDC057668]|uniref:hypothetical protein n=1 Tax=Nocardia sp. NPDC057668 TaxID=3346202 RepID=UPI00366E63A6